MRIPLILAIAMLVIQLATDAYLFFVAWNRRRSLAWAKFQLCEAAFFLVYVIVLFCLPFRSGGAWIHTVMWLILIYLTVYAGKVTFVIFDLLAQIPVLIRHRPPFKRLSWLSWIGAGAGVIVSLMFLWGATINRFNLQVNEVSVEVDNLPESFNGYRIAQISDLHVGTYGTDTDFLEKLVKKVNDLEPDLIVFTGDIVNQHSGELAPFIETLGQLHAPDGVFSILGNHDYGDYYDWESDEEKEQNLEQLLDMMITMNWEPLTNSSEVIYGRENPQDSLVVLGVENWGDPPFPQKGDIVEAYNTPADSVVKILLTHNPVHWTETVAPCDTMNIALTLSGHTHAMQMQLGSFSPARWRYPGCWAGRYYAPDGKRMLYVNIGIGTVGLPMRIGATPEITVFTLLPSNNPTD